jgi:hypothetical protein
MGSLKQFRIGQRRQEFESHRIWVSKREAVRSRDYLKKHFGNQIHVRIAKSPRHEGFDVFTFPDEREFNRLKRR